MIIIGLTGSIAMGKTATAEIFAQLGIPVFDADAAVHDLYAAGGTAVAPVAKAFAGVVVNGAVDRKRLAGKVMGRPEQLARLEKIVHPLVHAAERAFIEQARSDGQKVIVLDIPLLFETGRDGDVTHTLVVSAPPDIQRRRALARPGMTAQKLDAILARQMSDAQKRRRADFVVDTSRSPAHAEAQVRAILARLTALAPERAP